MREMLRKRKDIFKGNKIGLWILLTVIGLISLISMSKPALAGTPDYIYGKNSSGVFVKTDVSLIPAGTIANYSPIEISPDGRKVFGSDASKALVYQDPSTAMSGSSGSSTTVAGRGEVIFLQ